MNKRKTIKITKADLQKHLVTYYWVKSCNDHSFFQKIILEGFQGFEDCADCELINEAFLIGLFKRSTHQIELIS